MFCWTAFFQARYLPGSGSGGHLKSSSLYRLAFASLRLRRRARRAASAAAEGGVGRLRKLASRDVGHPPPVVQHALDVYVLRARRREGRGIRVGQAHLMVCWRMPRCAFEWSRRGITSEPSESLLASGRLVRHLLYPPRPARALYTWLRAPWPPGCTRLRRMPPAPSNFLGVTCPRFVKKTDLCG